LIVDSDAKEKVSTGVYKGFSVGGNIPKGGRDPLNKNIITAINTYGTCDVKAVLVGTIVRIYSASAPNGTILEEGGNTIHVTETMNHTTFNQHKLDDLCGTKDTYEAHGMITVTAEMLLSDVYIELPFTIKFLWALFPMQHMHETVVVSMTQDPNPPYAVTATTKEITIPIACTATATSSENDVILDLSNGSYPCLAGDLVYWMASGDTLE
jgi:hypothetical protein